MSYSQEYVLKKHSDARQMHGDINHDILYNSKIWKYLNVHIDYGISILRDITKTLQCYKNIQLHWKILIIYLKLKLKRSIYKVHIKKLSIYWEYLSLKYPHGKEMQKGKMIIWGGLTNSCEKRSKKQRRKGKIFPFECRVPKNSQER